MAGAQDGSWEALELLEVGLALLEKGLLALLGLFGKVVEQRGVAGELLQAAPDHVKAALAESVIAPPEAPAPVAPPAVAPPATVAPEVMTRAPMPVLAGSEPVRHFTVEYSAVRTRSGTSVPTSAARSASARGSSWLVGLSQRRAGLRGLRTRRRASR